MRLKIWISWNSITGCWVDAGCTSGAAAVSTAAVELLLLLEQIEEQLGFQELLELQEQQLGLLLDFVLQH